MSKKLQAYFQEQALIYVPLFLNSSCVITGQIGLHSYRKYIKENSSFECYSIIIFQSS